MTKNGRKYDLVKALSLVNSVRASSSQRFNLYTYVFVLFLVLGIGKNSVTPERENASVNKQEPQTICRCSIISILK